MPSTCLTIVAAAAAVITVITVLEARKKTGRVNKRKLWTRRWLQRKNEGRGVLNMVENELRFEDKLSYKNFLRMDHAHFVNLLEKIRIRISKQDTNMRECISPEKRLAITLRFLATGETYRSLMYTSRIHESTISKIVPEVCKAIHLCLKEEYLKCPSTIEEWENVAEQFELKWNYPLCLGALDGKHICFRPPRSAGSYYYNYKGTHSIVLLALVDANYSFLYIDVGVNGRISDGGVFRESTLYQAMESNYLNFPPNRVLPGSTASLPYTLIADDAFPLSQRVMKPFPHKNLTFGKRIFNYRLSRARRVVENAFGILSNRFRVLLSPINLDPEKVEMITLACCCLHNYLIITNPNYTDMLDRNDQRNTMQSLRERQSGNRSSRVALELREEFMKYFLSEKDGVPWQNDAVNVKFK